MTPSSCFDPAAIRAALGPYAADTELYLYDTLDSTNTEAKRQAASAGRPDTLPPSLLIARTQTEGRGRLGRSFHSPADTGLYMTYAYTVRHSLEEAVRVTAGAAVAATAAIESLTGISPAIKWVNDLYLHGAKIAGILTEAVTLPGATRMVVGLGLNLTTADFPADLRAPAAGLFSDASSAPEAAALPSFMATMAGDITRRLRDLIEAPVGSSFPGGLAGKTCLDFYRRHALYMGESVRCTRGHETFEGTVIGIREDYALLLSAEGQTVALSSGEISVRPRSE